MSQITKEILPNGLTVLVAERRESPVVAINLWVRAGYFDEADSQIGVSHVIEHMFFKGTPDRPRPDQIATEIKNLGGELNAGTYYESTHYYIVLPSENFRKGLEIQADALMHPLFDPDELKREQEAVLQEARRKIDTPGAYAFEMLCGTAFETHRLRRWRIGTEEGIRAMTRDDLLAYYTAHYVPSRTILAVVGDVETGHAIETAHVYLGGMEPAEGAVLGSPPEPPQKRFKYRRMTGDIKRACTMIGFHAPPALTDDDFPVRVMAHVLGAGRSSRLFQSLKERDGLVDSIGASVESFSDIGILALEAENDPRTTPEVVRAMQAEIERIRRDPPSATEIARTRAAIEFRYHQNRSEVLGLASLLAHYEAMGSYALAEEAVERLKKVTSEDVRRVAETYLDLNAATVFEYLPESSGVEEMESEALLERLRSVEPGQSPAEATGPRPPAPGATPAPQVRVTSIGTAGPVEKHRFDSGAVLLCEERRTLPLVTFCVAFRGGRTGEGRENCGITRLMQATMLKGTPHRDARQVAVEVDGLGTSIHRVTDEDYFGFAISVLSKHARNGLELLMELVRRPAFRHEELDKERTLQLAAQEAIKDQSLPYTFQLFRQAAFGSHPYALPVLGLEASVQAMKREDLVRWHRANVHPGAMVVSVVGDTGVSEAIDMVGRSIAEWSQEGHGGKDPGQLLGWGAAEAIETRRRLQTSQVIGFPTPGLISPERFSLDLVQAITSGLSGRFFEAVRGKRGLAYAVHAFNYHRVSGGAFTIYLATSPQNEAEARRVLLDSISQLRHKGPRRAEVDRGKRYTRGVHAISLQSNGARAVRYVDAEVRGLGVEAVLNYPDHVAGVGYEEVHDAIWRYLDPDRCAIGILRGDATTP